MDTHHDLDDAINLLVEELIGSYRDDSGDLARLITLTQTALDAASTACRGVTSSSFMHLITTIEQAVRWYQDTTGATTGCALNAIRSEYDRAHTKHHGNTPLNHTMSDRDRSVILLEEVGEVARALTPDAHTPTGHAGDLADELIQVATMAAAWLQHEIHEISKHKSDKNEASSD